MPLLARDHFSRTHRPREAAMARKHACHHLSTVTTRDSKIGITNSCTILWPPQNPSPNHPDHLHVSVLAAFAVRRPPCLELGYKSQVHSRSAFPMPRRHPGGHHFMPRPRERVEEGRRGEEGGKGRHRSR
jgi:hypothetical protein